MPLLMEVPVKRKTKKALKLTAHHAVIALNMLVQEGKIVAADIAGTRQYVHQLVKGAVGKRGSSPATCPGAGRGR